MSPTKKTPKGKTSAAESKRDFRKQLSQEAIRALCEIKSDERLDAQRAYNRAEKAFRDEAEKLDKPHAETIRAQQDAKAELEAHADYLKPKGPVATGEMTRKEYDDEHRTLEAAVKAADAAVDASRKNIQDALASFRARAMKADTLVQDLTRQWHVHEKRAKAAGIDVSDLWTPGDDLPAEDSPAPADAPAEA